MPILDPTDPRLREPPVPPDGWTGRGWLSGRLVQMGRLAGDMPDISAIGGTLGVIVDDDGNPWIASAAILQSEDYWHWVMSMMSGRWKYMVDDMPDLPDSDAQGSLLHGLIWSRQPVSWGNAPEGWPGAGAIESNGPWIQAPLQPWVQIKTTLPPSVQQDLFDAPIPRPRKEGEGYALYWHACRFTRVATLRWGAPLNASASAAFDSAHLWDVLRGSWYYIVAIGGIGGAVAGPIGAVVGALAGLAVGLGVTISDMYKKLDTATAAAEGILGRLEERADQAAIQRAQLLGYGSLVGGESTAVNPALLAGALKGLPPPPRPGAIQVPGEPATPTSPPPPPAPPVPPPTPAPPDTPAGPAPGGGAAPPISPPQERRSSALPWIIGTALLAGMILARR